LKIKEIQLDIGTWAVEKVLLTAKVAKFTRKGRKAKIHILNPLRALRNIFAFSAVNGF
jgi:hypothetical protein